MTITKKISKEAGKSAHHNDELQDLVDGRQKPELKKLVRLSAIMDRRAVESAAQIGRECVGHRRSTRLPWWQTSLGVHFGSLGFRSAQSFALLAFIASRVLSRSLISMMVE